MKKFKQFSLVIQKFLLAFFVCFGLASFVWAEVSSVEISTRQPYAGGMNFGEVGAYEEIKGRIHYEIDPANPRNQIIVDLNLAPLNSRGMIEMSGDFEIMVPLNPDNGNGVAIIDIPNRGNGTLLRFNQAPASEAEVDSFLMNEGYTLVWVGWEFDVSSGLKLDVPVTTDTESIAISGLGLAAARDIASWIKHSPNALVSADYLLSFGLSQTGRYLRSFLYLGFNADEADRQVFDGMIPHIAGSSRIDVNRRGAAPVSMGQFDATSYPFADAAYMDSISGDSEGLLENSRASEHQPKIFYTNTDVEYWGGGRAASLIHSTPDGRQDIELPDNVRFYLLASAQHSPVLFPETFPTAESGNGQFPYNHLNYWWHMRALLSALTDWVVDDIEPPASAHPTLRTNTLVGLEDVNFPAIPNVQSITYLSAGIRMANPLLENHGAPNAELPFLLPQVNLDGNGVSGLLHPEIVVPLATYTGWNFYSPGKGDPEKVVTNAGSYIPFALDNEGRELANDPRLSIAERYTDKQDFLGQIASVAQQGIDSRYLLASDKAAIIAWASRHWDLLMSSRQ